MLGIAKRSLRPRFCVVLLICVLLLVVFVDEADARKKRKRKQRHNQAGDKDYREAYGVCEADASKCGAIKPDSAKPPCVLKCMSPKCYQEVYGQDALEEGELDYTRRREYKTCFRKEVNERRALEKEAERQKQRET